MTEQIYYSHWGSESEEHKDYFYTIGTIANWIGYALIGPSHTPYTTNITTRSNISVLQTKEKFGSPRVYVSFSEDSKLEDVKHYRHTYQTAIKLFPQYEKSIRTGMDHEEFLFESNGQIYEYIQDKMMWLQKGRVDGQVDNDFYLERLEKIREEQDFLKKVCDLT
tara:strand:- start:948 stop:1442 length:495 start_codon:yes stop_codon:yes gene_type:complete